MAWLLVAILLVFFPCAADEITTITLLHTSDLHAHLLPDSNGKGGFAELRATILEQKKLTPDSLLLDAGDMVQGTPVSTIYKGLPIFEVANLMGFDATILGNHEFDYGWQQISNFCAVANFPILCANVIDGKKKILADSPDRIFVVKGVRIAVIGLLTEDLPHLTTPNLLGETKVESILTSVRYELDSLKNKAEIFIVLGHLRDPESDSLARQFPELTAVIAGHPHLSMKEPRKVGSGIVVSVANYGRELGRLDLGWSKERGKVVSINWRAIPVANIEPDPLVNAAVQAWERRVASVVDIPIGTAAREFTKPEVKELTERALKEQLGVDFAFANIGGIRDQLPRGTILARHIWNIHPFDNRVVIGRFKGSDLPPSVTGQNAVIPQKVYTLAVSDFVAVNQAQMGTNGLQFPPPGDTLMRDIVIDWVKKQKVLQ
ncbi:MAG: metallophosphoesterase [Verrucomicrobiales bacterium]|nr:metallophosphoesterase [Verrucomicrobiales bacterium]